MVRVISWQKRQKESGVTFNVLSLQGGIEMIKSAKSGKFYATARKANLVCTFDDATCNSLIGTEFPGSISKEECDPYEYTVPNGGETILLTHTYVYTPDSSNVEENVFGIVA